MEYKLVNINFFAIIIPRDDTIIPNLTNLRKPLREREKSEALSKNTGISSGNISDWKTEGGSQD